MGHQISTVNDRGYAPFFSILGNSNYYYKDSMDPVSARGSFIWFLITALSVKAGSLANDAQPRRKAALTLVDALRQNEGLINSPTDLKAILPVEVDISDLVSKFNVRFQALGGKVTRLGDQLRIIEEENARVQNAFKEKLTKLETQLQTSKEEADGLREQLKASNEQKAGQQCPQGRKGAECRRNLCPQGRKGAECRKNNNPDDSDDGEECAPGRKGKECRKNRKNNNPSNSDDDDDDDDDDDGENGTEDGAEECAPGRK